VGSSSDDGMRASGIVVDHLACLVSSNTSPYAAVLKVGRVMGNE
jgi:hypothetical protein